MQISFGGEAHDVPPAAVIGVIGETGSGVADLLSAAGASAISYTLDAADEFTRCTFDFDRPRRAGRTILLASHDLEFVRRVADEVWWVRDGRVVLKADPGEAITAYRRYVAERVRQSCTGVCPALSPAMRRGDGRAELVAIGLYDRAGQAVSGWTSGEEAVVQVAVRFHAAVDDPVVGIMIRTRVGMEVYGTNTELEQVRVGPCEPGSARTVEFRFTCNLCPQTYTLTAASHDPDGVWHDWLEDAVAFTVGDYRYTAGVANLRARVTCFRE
jgi:lipopolysaccharide transport system ATP-binding protein